MGRSSHMNVPSQPPRGTRKPFHISSVLYRVGAPLLRPLPLVCDYLHKSLDLLPLEYFATIIRGTYVILAQSGLTVDDADVDLTPRYAPGDQQGTERLTVLISTSWTVDAPERWVIIVRAIKTGVDAFMDRCGLGDMDMHVEMIATKIYAPQRLERIQGRPDLDKVWDKVGSDVEGILQDYEPTRYNWDSIMLLGVRFICFYTDKRYGLPLVPTVYIMMSRSCPETAWECARVRIQLYLARSRLELSLRMQHSDPAFGVDVHAFRSCRWTHSRLHVLAPYTDRVPAGGEIGAGSDSFGTLGCYVELDMRDGTGWQKFALTNYRSMRSALEISERTAADRDGFRRGEVAALAPESPSRVRHDMIMDDLNDILAMEGRDESLIARRDTVAAFFADNKQNFGTLWAGSGLAQQTEEGAWLDWALIRVEADRVGANRCPTRKQWGSLFGDLMPEEMCGIQLTMSPTSTNDATRICKVVSMFGAMSLGAFPAHKARVRRGTSIAQELVFVLCRDDLCAFNRGDSGSVVTDHEGRVLGMIWTADERYGFLTPMTDVFKHIETFLSADIKGIRLAGVELEQQKC